MLRKQLGYFHKNSACRRHVNVCCGRLEGNIYRISECVNASVIYFTCKLNRFCAVRQVFVWWPRELNMLQLQKTHANRKSTSKSRKHLHQFDSRCCKCSQHNPINNFICSSLFGCVVSICLLRVVKLIHLFS